jgi:hypothetical protein
MKELLGIISAFVILIAGYAMIWAIFKKLDAVAGQLGDVASRVTGGLNKRLSERRSNIAGQNMNKMRTGQRFEGSRFIPGSRGFATRFNRTTAGISTGAKGHFGIGARGREAVAQTGMHASAEIAKSGAFMAIQEDDSAMQAATYSDRETALRAMTARVGATEANRAVNAVVASGMQFGRPLQVAAAKQLANTGTGFANTQDMVETIARASNGNATAANDMVGYINATNKKTGRWELAPGYGNLSNIVQRRMQNPAAVTQADYDRETMRAVAESASAGEIAGRSKPQVFKAVNDVLERVTSAGYAGTEQDRADLLRQVEARSMEFDQNVHAMAAPNAAMTQALHNRLGTLNPGDEGTGRAVTEAEQRDAQTRRERLLNAESAEGVAYTRVSAGAGQPGIVSGEQARVYQQIDPTTGKPYRGGGTWDPNNPRDPRNRPLPE